MSDRADRADDAVPTSGVNATAGAGSDAPRVVVISGVSGAGRTTVAKALEDLGYYVIDNLPPALIGRVVDLAAVPESPVKRLALVIDTRSRELSGDVAESLDELARRGLDTRTVFLEASDEALVARYEEGRRAHPLAGGDRVADGIARERHVLSEVRERADIVIDTTEATVHDLRARVSGAFSASTDAQLAVNVVSFGYKYGTPRDADIVLDVRFLPNPHWVPELQPLSGSDETVVSYVLKQAETGEFLERVFALFDVMVPGFVREGKHYLTVAVGCTGGRHRSVVLTERIAEHLRTLAASVRTRHRDRDAA